MQDNMQHTIKRHVVALQGWRSRTAARYVVIAMAMNMLSILNQQEVNATSFFEATQAQIVFTGTARQITAAGESTISGELGRGVFSYQSTNADQVYISHGLPVFPVPPQIAVTPDMNLRLVDAVQISILGINFSKNYAGAGSGTSEFAVDYFWHLPLDASDEFPDATSSMGPAMVVEYGPPGNVRVQNDWRFGYTRGTYLSLHEDGSWLMVHPVPTSENPELASVTATGTWRAEPVPEPLTVIGSVMALGFGWGFRRLARQRRSVGVETP